MSRWILPQDSKWSVGSFLSLAVAASCLRAFDELGFREIFWKYPNDLFALIPPKATVRRYGKLGGILIEPVRGEQGEEVGWIAGIGINLRPVKGLPHVEIENSAFPPVSLSDLFNDEPRSIGPLALGCILSKQIGDCLTYSSPNEVLWDLDRRLLWKEQWVAYKLRGETAVGRIMGLGSIGDLLLKGPDGHLHHVGPNVTQIRPVESGRSPIG